MIMNKNLRLLAFVVAIGGLASFASCKKCEACKTHEQAEVSPEEGTRLSFTPEEAKELGVSIAGIEALSRMDQSKTLDATFNFKQDFTGEPVKFGTGKEDEALMKKMSIVYASALKCPPPKIFCPPPPISLTDSMKLPIREVENVIILAPADTDTALDLSLQLTSLEKGSEGVIIGDSRKRGSTLYCKDIQQQATILGSVKVPGSKEPFIGTARYSITVRKDGKVIYDSSSIVEIQ